MIIELNDNERASIGFALAAYLEDVEKRLKRYPEAMKQIHEIERITYTKIIPEAWSGPKPLWWKE